MQLHYSTARAKEQRTALEKVHAEVGLFSVGTLFSVGVRGAGRVFESE
jgi:hypothetical protein